MEGKREINGEQDREGGKEGRREGGKEGRREGGKEGRREGGKEVDTLSTTRFTFYWELSVGQRNAYNERI